MEKQSMLSFPIALYIKNLLIDVPKAPGLGLVLERVHYENYDRRHEKTHQPLSFWGDEVEEKIQEVKFDLITKEILESEIRQQSMMQWLADLVHHDFATDPESEEPPHKSFVTMAAAQANLAINETDECGKSLQHETTQVSVEVGSTTERQENKFSEASLSRS
uniref:Receptor-like protein 12 n=1 Tax=Heterorhabditis bacteriophora TaxID=37862 RepID=A0A1I7X478_HETBA